MILAFDLLQKVSARNGLNKHRDQSMLLVLFHQWFQLPIEQLSAGNPLYETFIEFLLTLDDSPLAIEPDIASNLLKAVYFKYENNAKIDGKPHDEFW